MAKKHSRLTSAQREPEARTAIAEAEGAELLAHLAPSSIKPRSRAALTPGSSARPAWCKLSTLQASWRPRSAPPSRRPQTATYEPAASQGIVAGANLSALLKTDASAQRIAYGDVARGTFAPLLSHRCPDKLAGLSSGYLGETGDRSPLFNAARYLGYAARTEGMLVLDFDLRLEGMTIVKDTLLTGPKLRLSGVAFLWYRVHEPDGTLRMADAVRRISRPVEVDLRGDGVNADFFGLGR